MNKSKGFLQPTATTSPPDTMTKRNPKKYPRRCKTPRCRGCVVSKRCKSPYCAKCKWKMWNGKNPLRAAFKHLRNHAKERGKDFSLTFDQFRAFAEKTDYMKCRGRTSLSLSIDRIDNSRGYHADNIQAITLRENSRKQFVPYWAKQMPNAAYEPTTEEIAAAEKAMAEYEK